MVAVLLHAMKNQDFSGTAVFELRSPLYKHKPSAAQPRLVLPMQAWVQGPEAWEEVTLAGVDSCSSKKYMNGLNARNA